MIHLVGPRHATCLVLAGLQITIRLGGPWLTRCVGVRLLDTRAPPGECLRHRTHGDQDLMDDLLV